MRNKRGGRRRDALFDGPGERERVAPCGAPCSQNRLPMHKKRLRRSVSSPQDSNSATTPSPHPSSYYVMHHASYLKISARDRELSPRFYYKRTRAHTCLQRLRRLLRRLLVFFFAQVGVCCLVALYMVAGAVVFSEVEADSQMEEAAVAERARRRVARGLWNVTLHHNVLFGDEWRRSAEELIEEFQADVIRNVHRGYTGTEPGVRIWTFTAALMYSLTVFTTIGYGNLTPKTDVGKILTIVYALIGIPLMLLYMTNIGHILGSSFKYTYSKICRCQNPSRQHNLPSTATLPAVLSSDDDNELQYKGSSLSKSKRGSVESKLGGGGGGGGRQLKSTLKPLRKVSTNSSYSACVVNDNEDDAQQQQQQQQQEPDSKEVPDGSSAPPASSAAAAAAAAASLAVPRRGDSPRSQSSLKFTFMRKISNNSMTPSIKEEQPSYSGSSSVSRSGSVTTPMTVSAAEETTRATAMRAATAEADAVSVVAPRTNTVEFKLVEDIRLITIPVSSCLLVLFTYILLGTVIFSAWEGWSYLDGAYFCFTSLMTIGFGDFVPGNEYIFQISDEVDEVQARAKLVIGTIYILLGMALVAMCLNLMQEKVVVQVRAFARRVGLIRPLRGGDRGGGGGGRGANQ